MWYLEVHFNTCIDYFDGENAGAFAFIWSRAGKSLKFGGGGGGVLKLPRPRPVVGNYNINNNNSNNDNNDDIFETGDGIVT